MTQLDANGPRRVARRALLLAPSLLARPALAEAAAIRIAGSGSALGLMRQLGARHQAAGGVPVDVLPSLGSVGAVRALADGHVDIAVAIAQQPANAPAIVMLGRTPICAACHPSRPATALSGGQLAALLLAEQRHWPDGSPARLVLRPQAEGEAQSLSVAPAALRRAAPGPADRRGLPVAMTAQDNAALLAGLPGSLGLIGLAQCITEALPVQLITIDGEQPSVESLAAGRWPLAVCLVAAGQTQPRPEARALLDFLAAATTAPLLASLGVLANRPDRSGA